MLDHRCVFWSVLFIPRANSQDDREDLDNGNRRTD